MRRQNFAQHSLTSNETGFLPFFLPKKLFFRRRTKQVFSHITSGLTTHTTQSLRLLQTEHGPSTYRCLSRVAGSPSSGARCFDRLTARSDTKIVSGRASRSSLNARQLCKPELPQFLLGNCAICIHQFMSAPTSAREAPASSPALEVNDVEFCILHLRQAFIDTQVPTVFSCMFPNIALLQCPVDTQWPLCLGCAIQSCRRSVQGSPSLCVR